jgi:hypothetical protein
MEILTASPGTRARGEAATGSSGTPAGGRGPEGPWMAGPRRLAVRAWALLHAQALLQGTADRADGMPLIEDDRFRMARRGK